VKPYFDLLAAYNAWANERIYEAASRLSDDAYRADRGVFFKSLHGTLNHLLVADRIWLKRFTGTGEAPNRLDAILFDSFEDLRDARRAEDRRILAYVDGLQAEDLSGRIRYTTISKPEPIEQALGPALLHFFNHHTHHRGQAHAVLTGLTGEAPSLDLLYFQRETGAGF
jgi:uncharacterized damage-inducible protein DinB